ncbi:MAG: hypothetical protein KAT04_14885 [Methylococcales bacterium]|nr:hypothetical protein [Methylococcales bacterium]
MNRIEDVTLFAIQNSEDGLSIHMYIDTTGTAENPNYVLDCNGVIMSSIQNCFDMDDGLPTYVALVDITPIESENVYYQLKKMGFSFTFENDPDFGKCYSVKIETGDFFARVFCRKVNWNLLE